MGKKGITTRDEDTVVDVFTASTHDYILFFTDTGKVYKLSLIHISTSRAVAAKSSIPALEGILLEGGDTLTLSGYNMQTGIRKMCIRDSRKVLARRRAKGRARLTH